MTIIHVPTKLSPRTAILCGTATLLLVAACGSDGARSGIASLGSGFVNAFQADPNDAPVDPTEIALTVEPNADPFNP